MKNIHILPTDKPSRLYFNVVTKELLLQDRLNTNPTSFPIEKRNIYITNDEEIKEDYIIAYGVVIKVMMFDNNTLFFVNGTKAKRNDCKKIILTTDQDLIKDGVQAIPDEFLNWFVKNPSCEEVETYSLGIKNQLTGESGHYKYEIIIPKEELTLANMRCGCIRFEANCFTGNCRICGFPPREEPKQETLEEAAERLAYDSTEENKGFPSMKRFIDGAKWQQENVIINSKIDDIIELIETNGNNINDKPLTINDIYSLCKRLKSFQIQQKSVADVFREGIKWQQERSYSEEDMRKAFIAGGNSLIEEDDCYGSEYRKYMEKWFEQFKKK